MITLISLISLGLLQANDMAGEEDEEGGEYHVL